MSRVRQEEPTERAHLSRKEVSRPPGEPEHSRVITLPSCCSSAVIYRHDFLFFFFCNLSASQPSRAAKLCSIRSRPLSGKRSSFDFLDRWMPNEFWEFCFRHGENLPEASPQFSRCVHVKKLALPTNLSVNDCRMRKVPQKVSDKTCSLRRQTLVMSGDTVLSSAL